MVHLQKLCEWVLNKGEAFVLGAGIGGLSFEWSPQNTVGPRNTTVLAGSSKSRLRLTVCCRQVCWPLHGYQWMDNMFCFAQHEHYSTILPIPLALSYPALAQTQGNMCLMNIANGVERLQPVCLLQLYRRSSSETWPWISVWSTSMEEQQWQSRAGRLEGLTKFTNPLQKCTVPSSVY